MRKISSIIAVLFLFVGTSFGQEPTTGTPDKFIVPIQKILGADDPVSRGEIVILKVSPPRNVQYLERVSYVWKILVDGKEKNNLLRYPDNMTVAFGVGKATKIQALLVCQYLYVVREKQDDPKSHIVEVAQRSSDIIITNVNIDDVPPGPNPTPNPDPVIVPDTKFGLTKAAYNSSQKVDVAYRSAGAKAYATVLSTIVTRVQAGAIVGLEQALTEAKAAGTEALRQSQVPTSAWNVFGLDLQTALYNLYKDNKLNTKEDIATAFNELVAGLKLVK